MKEQEWIKEQLKKHAKFIGDMGISGNEAGKRFGEIVKAIKEKQDERIPNTTS